MVTVVSASAQSTTYAQPFYNLETEESSEWIVLGNSVLSVVSCVVPDANEDFQTVPTTFGLDGSTLINVEGGQRYEIGRWFEERKNVVLNVLIYDTTSKRFVRGQAFNVKQNFYTDFIILTLSTGEILKCSPDMPFYMHNGTWKEAQDLVANDQLKSYFSLDINNNLIISE